MARSICSSQQKVIPRDLFNISHITIQFYVAFLTDATLRHGVTNDDGGIMGPAENRDNRALMVTWNAPFASCVRSVTGGPAMPGEETFLCAPHQMQRERKLGYIIHQAAHFSCRS